MRIFIAVEFQKEIKEYLAKLQEQVKGNCKSGNFTPMENFHLTLQFIGEAKKEEIDVLSQAIFETAQRNKEFTMMIQELGFFARGTSNIVWAGLGENKNLMRLVNGLEKNLEKQGYSKEKRGFSPHITLAREAVLFINKEKVKEKIKIEKKEISVNCLSLMESVRIGSKLIYRPLYTHRLKAGSNIQK